ncbi:hypothetical protein [Streptomyces sp. NRRL WC-3725]|uniref:hypothetical protein n=1 Tax=Streptomyces sp. NRRL WC-3725 TaxID=1463933 RepID=UPI0004CA327F|nr:hypothetical protein [Streptomyces sp. NRRL WC-3725]
MKTLQAIHTKAPYAKVVLMGYPQLVEDDHSCLPGAYEDLEAQWVVTLGNTLTTEMKGATEDAGSWAWYDIGVDDPDRRRVRYPEPPGR